MRYTILFAALGVSAITFAQTTKKTTTTKSPTKKTTTKKTTNTASKSYVSPTSVVNAVSSVSGGVSALSENEIISGLKEALSLGSQNASTQLHALDGFNKNALVRIPFPPEVLQVATKLRDMGFGQKVDEFEVTLNRAAEQASKEAAPIFVNAISQMTITDAKNILQGTSNSATMYLQGKTSDPLNTAFSPIIKNALNNTLATSKWTEITTLYNKLPFVTAVETDLVKYTTGKALSGLFLVVAQEEKKIRENPVARTTDILKKVFGSVGK